MVETPTQLTPLGLCAAAWDTALQPCWDAPFLPARVSFKPQSSSGSSGESPEFVLDLTAF